MRYIVVALLALATYGVLYHNLPCWAQAFDKTLYCQIKAIRWEKQPHLMRPGK